MNLPDNNVNAELSKIAPGILGAFVALLLSQETWQRKVPLFLAGSIAARFGTLDVARITGLDLGFTGFLLGVFGIAILNKIFELWATLELGPILRDALRKVLGLPTKEE
jgi:hypothetical protein